MNANDTSMPSARIRAALVTDLVAIEGLLSQCGLPLDGVREALPHFILAMDGDELVGVAGLEICRENALLRSVAVAPERRSHGLGRVLVTRLIESADAQGIRALYLLTTTADGYFPSFGFRGITRDEVPEDVRSTAEFESACPASAIVMRRELPLHAAARG